MRPLLLAFLCCSFATQAFAEGTESASSLWLMSLTRFRLAEQVPAFIDFQPRTSLDDSAPKRDGDLTTFIARGAVGYQLTQSVSLSQGYAVISSYEPTDVEHRAFQELLASAESGALDITSRIRLEQRLLDGVSGVSVRARSFTRLLYPTKVFDKVSFAVNEEVFFHLNSRDRGPTSGFDQNRLFLGLNFRLTETVGLDVGYQNQFLNGRRGAHNTMNHTTFLGILTSF